MDNTIHRQITLLKWKINLLRETKYSSENALRQLTKFYYKKTPSFSQNNNVKIQVDLQIIVPVYNAEKYLDACINSILSQKTTFSYRAIFVDDGSTDNSGKILDRYRTLPCIEVIHQANGGVSQARNRGLKDICGKYIMFVDADDILASNSIQALLETAFKFDSEIVEGSYRTFDEGENGRKYCHADEVCAYDSFFYFGFPWGKVIRSDCLETFCFPEGFLYEDTVMSTLLYPECNRTYAIPDIVYNYRNNASGITNTSALSSNCIDTFWIMKFCLEERLRRGQLLHVRDLDRYLFAVYRNWGRTYTMPVYVQESIFVLSSQLITDAFGEFYTCYSGKYKKILLAIQYRSFRAFLTLANNGYIE